MKRAAKRLAWKFLPRRLATQLLFLGPKRWLTYFVVQRLLRINSRVPWPVHWSSIVSAPDRIRRAAELPYLGHHPGCYIQAMNGIVVGRNVRYGPNVSIISANHDLLDYDKHVAAEPIKIGDNCWIGAGSILLPGVELGEHVVVAAGSVVTKSFGSNLLIGGVPASVISEIDEYRGSRDWGSYG